MGTNRNTKITHTIFLNIEAKLNYCDIGYVEIHMMLPGTVRAHFRVVLWHMAAHRPRPHLASFGIPSNRSNRSNLHKYTAYEKTKCTVIAHAVHSAETHHMPRFQDIPVRAS